MVIDSSALVAIFFHEPERSQFLNVIINTPDKSISAAIVLETTIVLESRMGEIVGKELDLFIADAKIRIVPVDVAQLGFARAAYRMYGKGRHPAALNFGDCFTYGLAKALNEPVLAKGNDFRKTDIALC